MIQKQQQQTIQWVLTPVQSNLVPVLKGLGTNAKYSESPEVCEGGPSYYGHVVDIPISKGLATAGDDKRSSRNIGTSGRRCSRSPLGGRLATTLVATIFIIIFSIFHFFHSIFSPSQPFLIEGVLGSKNLFSESCLKWPHYYREVISDF